MLYIKNFYVEENGNKSRLICNIDENDISKQIWFEVYSEYSKYLCYERCDSVVIGLLSYAMRNKHDIKSDVPITEQLLYNINEYLLPSLIKNDSSLYFPIIDANVENPLNNAGAVGTGLSCGVDSFHAVYNHINSPYPNQNLTHLCINNVGAFNNCYKEYGIENAQRECYERSINVAKELGVPLIQTDSNFAVVFPQVHLLTNTYSSIFAVYSMQKLWRNYYYASCHEFSEFSLKDSSKKDSSYYDLLLLNCFSHSELSLYSEGAPKNRLQKVQTIADYSLAQNNLHVCTRKSTNCGVCPKCRRTILELVAIDKLDAFSSVFDVEYYNKHEFEYLTWLYNMHLNGDSINEPTYEKLKYKITLKVKLYVYWENFVSKIKKKYKKIKKKIKK